MKICNYNHPEICHNGFDCPLCETQKENEQLTKEVARLEVEWEELKETIEELEKRIDRYESKEQ